VFTSSGDHSADQPWVIGELVDDVALDESAGKSRA